MLCRHFSCLLNINSMTIVILKRLLHTLNFTLMIVPIEVKTLVLHVH